MKQKPTIIKPDSSKSKRSEPNHFISHPSPPDSSHKHLNLRFVPKIIPEKYLLNVEDFEPFNKEPIIGGFGIINFVRNKKTGQLYAAKTSRRKTNPEERKFILRELNILMKLHHPTIIHFEGFSFQDFNGFNNITIFIDYKEKGTLFDITKRF